MVSAFVIVIQGSFTVLVVALRPFNIKLQNFCEAATSAADVALNAIILTANLITVNSRRLQYNPTFMKVGGVHQPRTFAATWNESCFCNSIWAMDFGLHAQWHTAPCHTPSLSTPALTSCIHLSVQRMDNAALGLALASLGITLLCQLLMGLQSGFTWLAKRKATAAAAASLPMRAAVLLPIIRSTVSTRQSETGNLRLVSDKMPCSQPLVRLAAARLAPTACPTSDAPDAGKAPSQPRIGSGQDVAAGTDQQAVINPMLDSDISDLALAAPYQQPPSQLQPERPQ